MGKNALKEMGRGRPHLKLPQEEAVRRGASRRYGSKEKKKGKVKKKRKGKTTELGNIDKQKKGKSAAAILVRFLRTQTVREEGNKNKPKARGRFDHTATRHTARREEKTLNRKRGGKEGDTSHNDAFISRQSRINQPSSKQTPESNRAEVNNSDDRFEVHPDQ